jgi:hypothetical protein
MRIPAFLLILFLTVSLFATATDATQVRYKSVEQLGSESSDVVRGQVSSIRSYWNADRSKIFTETIITVDESYKGSESGVVRLVQLGGEVDGVRVTVHGALKWREGEEVIVFLEPYRDDAFHVSGFCQGKFGIERDTNTGEVFVKWPAQDDVQIMGAPAAAVSAAARPGADRIPLESFLDKSLGRNRKGVQR